SRPNGPLDARSTWMRRSAWRPTRGFKTTSPTSRRRAGVRFSAARKRHPPPARLAIPPLADRKVAPPVTGGLTNREIARELTVAERTVETHLEHIFAKLGVQTRAEVAVWVTRQELETAQPVSATASRPAGRLGRSRE